MVFSIYNFTLLLYYCEFPFKKCFDLLWWKLMSLCQIYNWGVEFVNLSITHLKWKLSMEYGTCQRNSVETCKKFTTRDLAIGRLAAERDDLLFVGAAATDGRLDQVAAAHGAVQLQGAGHRGGGRKEALRPAGHAAHAGQAGRRVVGRRVAARHRGGAQLETQQARRVPPHSRTRRSFGTILLRALAAALVLLGHLAVLALSFHLLGRRHWIAAWMGEINCPRFDR